MPDDPKSKLVTEKKLPSRRGALAVPAIDPRDGAEWELRIWKDLLETKAKIYPWEPLVFQHCVMHILKYPTAIFRGVRSEDTQDTLLCYCGLPPNTYADRGVRKPAREGFLFVVYVNEHREIYNWRWEKCDADSAHLPLDYKTRYGEKVI